MAMRGWAGGLGALQDAAAAAGSQSTAQQITDALNAAAKGTTSVVQALKNPGVPLPGSSTTVTGGSSWSRGNNLWVALGAVAVIGGGIYFWKTHKRKK